MSEPMPGIVVAPSVDHALHHLDHLGGCGW